MHGAPGERDRDDRDLSRRKRPYCVSQRSLSSGRRTSARYAPASTITATSAMASRAKPRNAVRRSEGASGQTRNARVATPPTQTDAATRCSQSASSDEPGRVRLRRLVARERQAGRERERERERGPAQLEPVEVSSRRAGAQRRPRSRWSSRGTRYRSASSRRTVGDRRTGDPRSAAGARSTRAARTPAMPTSITRNAATTATRWKPRSRRSGTGPRRMTSRTTSGPMSSASAPKSAQRARSSRQVVPEAPTASVGGGAATPTPNVKTPAGECPSLADHAPANGVPLALARGATPGATTTCPSSCGLRRPREHRAVGCEHLDRVRGDRHRLVEAEPDLGRRRLDPRLRHRLRALERDVREGRDTGARSAAAAATSTRSARLTGRRARSARRWARRRGRRRAARRAARTWRRSPHARPLDAAAAPGPAGRARRRRASSRSRGGGTRSASTAMRSARGRGRRRRRRTARRPARATTSGLRSFPRTSASSTAPATSAACAQTACASRCIVENVEKIVITHSPTLDATTTVGKR